MLDEADLGRRQDWRLADQAKARQELDKRGLAARGPVLERRPDGACIYLDPMLGCTIYETRPSLCRVFHCGRWAAMLHPEERRDIEILGDANTKQMLASGLERAGDIK